MFRQKLLILATTLMFAGSFTAVLTPTAQAYYNNNDPYYQQNYYNNQPTYFQRHPYIKKAAIGAGIGAGAGLLFGHSGSGALKGALLGSGVGLGYEYLRQRGGLSNIFH